jgi:hypothetical protein
MPAKKRNEGLPIAVATQGGLLSALAVLMIGTVHGGRAWIILVKAGTAFLLSSAVLKILTAGVMTGVSMNRTPEEKPRDPADEIEETAEMIASISPEPVENRAS